MWQRRKGDERREEERRKQKKRREREEADKKRGIYRNTAVVCSCRRHDMQHIVNSKHWLA
jgi:hypothetical protein